MIFILHSQMLLYNLNDLNVFLQFEMMILNVFLQFQMILKPIILSLLVISLIGEIEGQSDILADIKYLHQQLYTKYWKTSQEFKAFQTFQHQKGLFESTIHFNVVDKKNSWLVSKLRQDNTIQDVNMFVTSFVLYGLLEAKQLKTISVDEHLFSESLTAIFSFRDKNTGEGIPQYVFWPQVKINGTYSALPGNLFSLINLLPNLPPFLVKYLASHGFGTWIYVKQIMKVFCIPADNDDSSVNLALLGFLKETHSDQYDFWNNENYNKKGYYQIALKYAYRPFDKSGLHPSSDELDTRSYFALHNFLKQVNNEAIAQNKTPSLILPTTWLINKAEEIKEIVARPLNANNVDASVCANFLFGLIYQIQSQQVTLSPELDQMMRNSADFLVYVFNQVIEKRIDLILMYYPSKYDFFWFVARVSNLLERMKRSDTLEYVYQRLSTVLRSKMTAMVLKDALTSKTGETHWAEFLGNFAGKERNQDAIFSTALALNALFDTWANKKGSDIFFREDIPKNVTDIIASGIKFIRSSLKSKKLGNTFFSGSIKSMYTSIPYFYPANVCMNSKNETINPQTASVADIPDDFEYHMKGYMEDTEYQGKLKLKWFKYDVPLNFTSFNDGKGMLFPYWSSESITRIMMISALSKYAKIKSNPHIDQ